MVEKPDGGTVQSTVTTQDADFVPKTVPQLYWRLVYFVLGTVVGSVVL